METEVVLGLGGNQGEREKLLFNAVEAIKERFQLLSLSSVYESEAWGGVAKGKFLNQVAVVFTDKKPEEVLDILQEIELEMGRTREEHWGDRTMDIDMLYFGDKVIQTERLSIPHPFLADRKFVLVPLLEILPEKKHPITGKTPGEILEECNDESLVQNWENRGGD
jgi:2-amino-4-hydroxy-6-hydroxymethyldihydropteridine diphosphokinase